MKRGKYEAPYVPKRNGSKKALAMLLSLVLVIGCVAGGTLAWLTAESGEVKNVFTTSDIGVQLKETTVEYKMIPGWDIAKNPTAWIETGSVDSFLFVMVAESENFANFMTYEIADGWTALNDADEDGVADDGVYYREVTSSQMGTEHAFSILKDDKVTVKDTVTKEMMTDTDFTQPTLTFTAYAHQLYEKSGVKFESVDAWANLNPSTTPDTNG